MIENKHIITYLNYGVELMIDGVPCELEGIDLHSKDTFIAERVNYKMSDAKLILYPFSDYKSFSVIVDEMTQYEMDMIDDNPDMVGRLSYDVINKMLENHIDIFHLISKDLAIDKNSLKWVNLNKVL